MVEHSTYGMTVKIYDANDNSHTVEVECSPVGVSITKGDEVLFIGVDKGHLFCEAVQAVKIFTGTVTDPFDTLCMTITSTHPDASVTIIPTREDES